MITAVGSARRRARSARRRRPGPRLRLHPRRPLRPGRAELRKACGPAPREACDVLAATALWWRIQLDPDSRALDRRVHRRRRPRHRVHRGVGRTRPRQTPKPGSTWAAPTPRGCSGACCATRSCPRPATASGSCRRSTESLELDPTLDDAYFGMGMYKYYADVAPAAAKMLRFLLLLPGGDRKVGLEQMLRAQREGTAAAGRGRLSAVDHLPLVREPDAARASSCSQALHEHYPGNPLFLSQIAQIQDAYQHDVTASLATWRTLLAAAREQRANLPMLAETQARLGIAAHARGPASDRPRDRAAAGGDRPATGRSVRLAGARLPAARRSAGPARRARRSGGGLRGGAEAARPRTIRTRCVPRPPSVCAAPPTPRRPKRTGPRSKAGGCSRRTTSPARPLPLERSLVAQRQRRRSRAIASDACCRR